MTEMEKRNQQNNWIIRQTKFDESEADYSDSIFFQGNGYVGARGFQDECITCEDYKRTTFINGVFEYIKTNITDMVNTPNFFSMEIHAADQEGEIRPVTPAAAIDGTYSRTLDLRTGVVSKTYRTMTAGGTLEVNIDRFLSLQDVHLALQRLNLVSVDFEGDLEVILSIDGDVRNNTIHDEQLKKETNPVSLLECMRCETAGDFLLLTERTRESGITLAEAAGIDVSPESHAAEITSCISESGRCISCRVRLHLAPGETAVICKKVCICTSRDPESWEDPEKACLIRLAGVSSSDWNELSAQNASAWASRWADSDIVVEGDDKSQLELRFAAANLIANYPVNDPNCSIGARGLTHGRYKGCYFWDTEIYMLPFYLLTNPESARNLLMYRYNTLDASRAEAKRFNLSGARYSWMCTLDGREQCETWDTGSSEIHITADIAYAVDLYWRVTGDDAFAAEYGLEMIIEICRYWLSRFSYDDKTGKYNLLWVKGPDEYGGVTVNNTYTVTMAVYGFDTAGRMLETVKGQYPEQYRKLTAKINFREEELAAWEKLTGNVCTGYDDDAGLVLEDDLFMLTEPVDIASMKLGDQPLYKTVCFDRLQRMRVLKQADVLLLMALLPEKYSAEEKQAAWNFYEPITLHDSTLSFGSHSLTGAMFGYTGKAYEYFRKSAGLDLEDLMRNTAEEGLHLAAFGGTWMSAVFGFAGLSLRDGTIKFDPHLPASWNSISFPFFFKGRKYIYRADADGASVQQASQEES